REPLENLRLRREPRAIRTRDQQLDRDAPLAAAIHRLEHAAHPAARRLADDLEPAVERVLTHAELAQARRVAVVERPGRSRTHPSTSVACPSLRRNRTHPLATQLRDPTANPRRRPAAIATYGDAWRRAATHVRRYPAPARFNAPPRRATC